MEKENETTEEMAATPEMIEAGVNELLDYRKGEDAPEVYVEMIYIAMARARARTLQGS
jgi:hypothetical protein